MVLDMSSLSHGLSIFQSGKSNGKNIVHLAAQAEASKVNILISFDHCIF